MAKPAPPVKKPRKGNTLSAPSAETVGLSQIMDVQSGLASACCANSSPNQADDESMAVPIDESNSDSVPKARTKKRCTNATQADCSATKQQRVTLVPSTLTQVAESQPTHPTTTTTIGQCGGEPDPLDDKPPATKTSQQTSKDSMTIHIEICPTGDVPSDAEELEAYEWAMEASISDAATRTSLLFSQPGSGGSLDTTTMLTGTTNTLPIGRGRYSASRRGSENSSPQDLKQVNWPVSASYQTTDLSFKAKRARL